MDIIFLAGPVAEECVDARNGAGGCRWLKVGKRLEAKPGIATAWVGAPSRRRKEGWADAKAWMLLQVARQTTQYNT